MFNFPVLRIGQVVKAEKNINPKQAEHIADTIVESESRFMDGIIKCYNDHGGSRPPQQVNDELKREVKETTIINFRAFEVYFKEYVCQSRVSLTVCCEEKRSKIWARMSLKKSENANANNFDRMENEKFYKYAEVIANCLVDATKKTYNKILRELGYAKKLEKRYLFRIFGINSHNKDLNTLFQEIENSRIIRFEDAVEIKPYRDGLSPLFKSSVKSPNEMIKKARSQDSYLQYFEGSEKDKEFKSFTFTKALNDKTDVTCLCYNEPIPEVKHTQADNATAAILDRYASIL